MGIKSFPLQAIKGVNFHGNVAGLSRTIPPLCWWQPFCTDIITAGNRWNCKLVSVPHKFSSPQIMKNQ